MRGELAGKRAIDSDRMGEVSRGHSSRETHRERPCGVIVDRDKVKARTEREDEQGGCHVNARPRENQAAHWISGQCIGIGN